MESLEIQKAKINLLSNLSGLISMITFVLFFILVGGIILFFKYLI